MSAEIVERVKTRHLSCSEILSSIGLPELVGNATPFEQFANFVPPCRGSDSTVLRGAPCLKSLPGEVTEAGLRYSVAIVAVAMLFTLCTTGMPPFNQATAASATKVHLSTLSQSSHAPPSSSVLPLTAHSITTIDPPSITVWSRAYEGFVDVGLDEDEY